MFRIRREYLGKCGNGSGQFACYFNLYFDNDHSLLEDVEPFSVNHLQSYLLRQDLLKAELEGEESAEALTRAQLSGKFPDLPTTATLFNDYQQDVQQFSAEINKLSCDNPEIINCTLDLTVDGIGSDRVTVALTCQLAVKHNLLVHYRSSSAKAKEFDISVDPRLFKHLLARADRH